MRRVFLAGSFLALVAALILMWNHRFEPVPGLPSWRLADLRSGVPEVPGVEWTGTAENPALRLKVDSRTPPVALRLSIPGIYPVEMLYLHHRVRARNLMIGLEKWEIGRIMIEWHPPGGASAPDLDSVGGAKLDEKPDPVTIVTAPEHGPALPALRLENLGRSGEFELTDLQITAVRERALWRHGRWFLLCGWLAWGFACFRPWPRVNNWRALAAAAIWLLMGLNFVVPGPWKSQRPIGGNFRLEQSPHRESSPHAPPFVAGGPPSALHSGAVSASGNIPPGGSLALRMKHLVAQARPLLHVLLLLAPTLASAWLVGRRPTFYLAVLLSIAIEAAQVAFGYGFDWIDVVDLATDAAGIALGLYLARRHGLRLPCRRWLIVD